MSARRAAAVAAVATLALVLLAAAVLLSRSAPRLAQADGARAFGSGVAVAAGQTVCQSGEYAPPSAATLVLGANPDGPGPPLELTVGGHAIHVRGGYGDGTLRVPLPADAEGPVSVCIRNAGRAPVAFAGQNAAVALPPGIGLLVDGRPQPLALQLRWMTAPRSGWSTIGPVLRRWGYVTALGAATPYVAIALFALAFGAAVALAVRGRATALTCGLVAFAACAGWALTTPALHVPDEPQHLAYVQRLAESGRVPTREAGPVFSPEEGFVFGTARFNQVAGNPVAGRPPWNAATAAAIDRGLRRMSRYTSGGVTNATNNPPLYYVAELGPYWVATAAGGDFLDRLLALRLGSAVLIALAAGFAFAFVRELLPRAPWAWPVGALAFAVQPLLGFIGGGVNNDAGLYAAAAAVFWLVARALRRGLDRSTAIGIGLAFGLGLITKATLVGIAPGLVLCGLLLLLRAGPERRGEVLRRIGLAAVIAAIPVAAYVLVNSAVWDRGLWGGAGVAAGAGGTGAGHPAQLREFVSYLWQFYLPRLPFMTDLQAGIPLYNVYFQGFIGRFGWLDTSWPGAVYTGAAAAFVVILALAAAGAWRVRESIRGRLGTVVVLAAMAAGFLLLVAWAGYRGRLDNGQIFEQARYLLPLGALYAAVLTLAARGAGRFGPATGAVLVALACGHAMFAVALVVSRFYA